VPDDYSVKQFKEKISSSMNIPIERQRLIFQGRELKDPMSLSEFDVNGKTIHLVQRVPPAARTNEDQSTSSSGGEIGGSGINIIPPPGANLNQDVQQIIQQLIGGLGEFGQNATFNASTTGDANGMEVHIDLGNLGNVSQLVNENEIRSRIRNIRRFLTMARSRLNRIEEIQSGAPLNDAPQHSTLIVGSIETTINPNFDPVAIYQHQQHLPNHAQLHQHFHHHQHAQPNQQRTHSQQRVFSTSIPNIYSSIIDNNSANVVSQATNPTNNVLPTVNPTSASNTSTTTRIQETTTTDPTESTGTATSTARTTPNESQEIQSISVQVLADLTRSVMDSYSRFQPFLQQYQEMLRNDANESHEESSANNTTTTTTAPTTTTTVNGDNSITTTTTTTITTVSSQETDLETGAALTTAPAPITAPSPSVSSQEHPNIVVLGGGDNRRQRFFNNINDMMHLLGHLFHNLSDLHVNIRDQPPRQIHTMSSMQHSTSAIISAIPIEASINISNLANLTNNGISATLQHHISPQTNASASASSTNASTNATTNAATNTLPQTQTQTQQHQQHFTLPIPVQTQRFYAARGRGRGILQMPITRTPIFSASYPNLTNIANMQQQQTAAPNTTTATAHANTSTQNPLRMPSVTTPTNTTRLPTGPPFPFRPTLQPHHQHPNPLTRLIRPSNIPNNHLIQQNSTLNSYDQYLPCNSVHFYNSTNSIIQQQSGTQLFMPNLQTQRRRHPAGDQVQPTPHVPTTNTSTTTTTSSSLSQAQTPQMGNDMHQMLSNLISSTIRNSFGGDNLTGPIGQAHIQVNIETNNSSPTSPNSNPHLASAGASGTGMFQMISSLIGDATGSGSVTDRLLLNQPFSELMRLFGSNGNYLDSTLNLFNIFVQSLRVGDLIDFDQNRESYLERTRQPLRDFLRDKYDINNFETDRASVDNFLDRLYLEMFIEENSGGLHLNLSQIFTMHDNSIDFAKSFEKLVKLEFRKILEIILDSKYDTAQAGEASWSFALFNQLSVLLYKLVTLSRLCIGGSASRSTSSASDDQIVQFCLRKLREMLTESSIDTFSVFFENSIHTRIQQLLLDINLERSSIEEIIIHKDVYDDPNANPPPPPPQTSAVVVGLTEDDDQYDSAASTLSGHSIDMDRHFSHAKTKSASQKQAKNNPESSDLPRSVLNDIASSSSSSWRNVFPDQWLPIIERDVQKINNSADQQQQQQPRAVTTYSDAYINGMPAKRRKLLFTSNDLLTKNLFKRVLSRTLEKVQLKSSSAANVKVEHIIDSALSQSRLIETFDADFDAAITDRLKLDADFIEIMQEKTKDDVDKANNDKEDDDNDPDASFSNQERFQNIKKRLN
jgi:hypothetical protein